MNARTMIRLLVAVLIVGMLGGAYVIVQNDRARHPATADSTPGGFFH
jgi:hypothetical protein